MAMINTGPNYTRTGNDGGVAGFFTSLGNKLSFIPFIGGPIASALIWVGTAFESVGWLIKGKPLSAATALGTGALSASIQAARAIPGVGALIYWGNLGSGVLSGRTIGTHARAAAEGVTSVVTRPLGIQPTVLRSYTAGLGSMSAQQQGPGAFMAAEARRRGQDPNAAYEAYRNGNADHVAALEASRENPQGAYRG